MTYDYGYHLAGRNDSREARKKRTCPHCGPLPSFILYIDTETGQPLNINVGKCDRLDNGAYHFNPYKDGYGRLSPDEWKAKRIEQTRQRNYIIPKPQPSKAVSFIDNATFNKSLAGYNNNPLIKGLCRVCTPAAVMPAVERYNVGTAKGGAIIFWQLDTDNKVRTGKVIHYKQDLHRDKDKPPYMVHGLRNLPCYDPHYNLQQCLFGLHLLNDITAPVGIVESEKTAIVASIYLSEFVWLATGGKQYINLIEKAAGQLKGRKVILFPDMKATADWEAKAQELRSKYKLNISVSDYLERKATEQERAAGLDLADFLLRTPPPKATAVPQPATPAETPDIERLQSGTKSIPEQETPAEGKETAQNRAIARLPKTQGGVCYGQTFAPQRTGSVF